MTSVLIIQTPILSQTVILLCKMDKHFKQGFFGIFHCSSLCITHLLASLRIFFQFPTLPSPKCFSGCCTSPLGLTSPFPIPSTIQVLHPLSSTLHPPFSSFLYFSFSLHHALYYPSSRYLCSGFLLPMVLLTSCCVILCLSCFPFSFSRPFF